jgi:hypothetical protein
MDSIKPRDFSTGRDMNYVEVGAEVASGNSAKAEAASLGNSSEVEAASLGNSSEVEVASLGNSSEVEAASLGNSSEVEAAQEADALTHVGPDGRANMVDVGGKADTEREAVAVGSIFLGMAQQ